MSVRGPFSPKTPTPTEAGLKSFAKEQLSSAKAPLGRKGVKAVLSQGFAKLSGRTPEVTTKQLKAYLKTETQLSSESIKSILNDVALTNDDFSFPLGKRTIRELAWLIDQALEQEQAPRRSAIARGAIALPGMGPGGSIQARSSAKAVRPLPPVPTGVTAKMKAEIEAAGKTMEITPVEERALGLLGSLITKPRLEKEDVQFLMHFLEGIAGDMKLNRKYLQLEKAPQEGDANRSQLIGELKSFTYNTQDIKHLQKIMPGLGKIENFLSGEPGPVPEENRLVLRDIKALQRMCKTAGLLDAIRSKCPPEHKRSILNQSSLFNAVSEVENIIEAIENKIVKEFSQKAKTGDLLVWDSKKLNELSGSTPSSKIRRIQDRFFPISHTGKLSVQGTRNKHTNMREIFGSYQEGSLDLGAITKSNFYSLRVERLIPSKYHEALRNTLGDNYMDEISKIYQNCEETAQSNLATHLINSSFTNNQQSTFPFMLKVAAAAVLPFGHKQLMPRPSGIELYEELLKGSKKEMFCSEHTAYVTLLATELLNQELCGALRQRYGQDFLKKEDVIKSPLGKHERIGVLDPTRLLEQLSNVKVDGKRVNALVKMGATPTEQAIFKKDAVSNAPDPLQLEVIKVKAYQDFHKSIAEDESFLRQRITYGQNTSKSLDKAVERMDTLLAEHATHLAEGYKFLAYQLGLEKIKNPDKEFPLPSREEFFKLARPAMLQTLFLQEGKKRAGSEYIIPVINSFLEPLAPERLIKTSRQVQVPEVD